MKCYINSFCSKSYWQYVLFSSAGIKSIFAFLGGLFLLVEILDFFKIYSRDKYASYALVVFLVISVIGAIVIRRPVNSISMQIPNHDITIEVRVDDLFDVCGAVMISTNTMFEADVAGGKISPDSLQGQFTARYFTGNQVELIGEISKGLSKFVCGPPYDMGTTVQIVTHGKTFYFTAMSDLNEYGNAVTTVDGVKKALEGLWQFVRDAGEFQDLVVPVIGTGRGRLKQSRKKIIALITESFVKASELGKFTGRLVVVIHPNDAKDFGVNMYDIKDHLRQILYSQCVLLSRFTPCLLPHNQLPNLPLLQSNNRLQPRILGLVVGQGLFGTGEIARTVEVLARGTDLLGRLLT